MKKERAGDVLPKRAAYLLGEPNRLRKKVKKEIRDLILQRNTIFHEGKPGDDDPELLAWYSHQLARNVINQVCRIMKDDRLINKGASSRLRTKDDLLRWIDEECRRPRG